jgi:hypothetical protein
MDMPTTMPKMSMGKTNLGVMSYSSFGDDSCGPSARAHPKLQCSPRSSKVQRRGTYIARQQQPLSVDARSVWSKLLR